MKVLVTGAMGQLGGELLRARWPDGVTVVPTDHADLDVTDRAEVRAAVEEMQPAVIVNAAAYTAVDRAEDEPDLAEAVNALAVEYLAEAANAAGARLIHVSTDYVFDGTKNGWYVETDPIAPLGVYGHTKARGEDAARGAARHLILRTAWVYGALGHNFVATMLRLAGTRDDIAVVDDQVGCPTAAVDLAAAIVQLIGEPAARELHGTYHLASPTHASWFELARAVLADEEAQGVVTVRPITTAEFPSRARRPANSRLDSSAILRARGIRARPWADALPEVASEIRESMARS